MLTWLTHMYVQYSLARPFHMLVPVWDHPDLSASATYPMHFLTRTHTHVGLLTKELGRAGVDNYTQLLYTTALHNYTIQLMLSDMWPVS